MNINKEKIIDAIVVLAVLVNTFLTMLGKNPIPYSEEEIYVGISSVASVLSTLYIWWKNNKAQNQVKEISDENKQLSSIIAKDKQMIVEQSEQIEKLEQYVEKSDLQIKNLENKIVVLAKGE